MSIRICWRYIYWPYAIQRIYIKDLNFVSSPSSKSKTYHVISLVCPAACHNLHSVFIAPSFKLYNQYQGVFFSSPSGGWENIALSAAFLSKNIRQKHPYNPLSRSYISPFKIYALSSQCPSRGRLYSSPKGSRIRPIPASSRTTRQHIPSRSLYLRNFHGNFPFCKSCAFVLGGRIFGIFRRKASTWPSFGEEI